MSSTKAFFAPLPAVSRNNGTATYRRIAEHLRSLIVEGKLKPGTRLPSIKEMASEWGTNYFTVQSALTPLANEGLIERSPRRGTFVRDRYAKLTSAGIYYGSNLWESVEGAFYQKACGELQRVLQERGIRFQVFLDTRPQQEHGLPLPELEKAVERREIQGVVGMMLTASDYAMLRSRGVPLALFSRLDIHVDGEANVDMALDELAARGCRSVGVIHQNVEMADLFRQKAAARGMATDPGWIRNEAAEVPHKGERHGYQSFKEIWSRQTRPEGLYIEHDWECRGAITAILELGVQVPQNLQLVLYRNSSVEYLCPWRVPTLVLDTRGVAVTMVDHLEAQHKSGGKVPPPMLHAHLVK